MCWPRSFARARLSAVRVRIRSRSTRPTPRGWQSSAAPCWWRCQPTAPPVTGAHNAFDDGEQVEGRTSGGLPSAPPPSSEGGTNARGGGTNARGSALMTTLGTTGESCVLMLAIIFALTGAAIGLRFKALVLAPASCFALASPVLTNFTYCYSLPVLALAMIMTLMALQIGYLLGMRLGVEVVDNFRDHVAQFTAGIYLTLLAEIVLVLGVARFTPGIYLTLLAGIVLLLGYAVWRDWQQHIIIAAQFLHAMARRPPDRKMGSPGRPPRRV